MTRLVNRTRGAAAWTVRYGVRAEERLVLALRATWDIDRHGRLTAHEQEPELTLVDTYRDDPATTSLAREAELAPAKPATDLVVLASAIAPARGTRQMSVTLACSGLPTSTLHVHGERQWTKKLFGVGLTEAKPFERCELIWEYAAGGADATSTPPASERRNPVGRGFRGTKSKLSLDEAPAPRITAAPDDLETPVGWGFIAPGWAPRADYGGTYDQAWQDERFPLLPKDFDARFFQTAPPALTAPGVLAGGPQLRVTGCHPEGDVGCTVPKLEVSARVMIDGESDRTCPLALATILFEPTDRRLTLLWRGELDIHRRLERMTEMEITATGDGLGVRA